MQPALTPTRRAVLKAALAASAAALVPAVAAAPPATAANPVSRQSAGFKPRFFSAKEYSILDEMAELIVPADQRSGGAREAKVPQIIDRMLAEMRDEKEKRSWRDDLAEIDRLSVLWFGKPFVRAATAQRIDLLRRVSRNEASPKEAGEYAFGTIKWTVTEAYYRSEIGMLKELDYKGNVAIDEFVGVDVGEQ